MGHFCLLDPDPDSNPDPQHWKKNIKDKKKGCAPERCNVEPEGLEGCLVLEVLHVEELDGHVAVPVPHVDSAEPTATDLGQKRHTDIQNHYYHYHYYIISPNVKELKCKTLESCLYLHMLAE